MSGITIILNRILKIVLPTLLPFVLIFQLKSSLKWNLMETLGVSCSFFLTSHFLFELCRAVYNTFIGPAFGHNLDLRSQGSWAVVTGATDGIGKSYTRELAQRGINVVLLSRTESKLRASADALETEFGVKTLIIAVDFTRGGEIYEEIRGKLKSWDLEIGVLVNNVGMAYPFPELFFELPNRDRFCQEIINCNILSATMMTGMVLPGMVERGRGVVINVGSMTSRFPTPYMTLYGASKSYLENFTRSLALEHKGTGITFQYIYPSYITTNLSKIKDSSWNIPTPEEFVQVAVKSIGLQEESAIWIPHRVISYCIKWYVFMRPVASAEVLRRILKAVWLYGKKNQMRKELAMR